MMSYYYCESSFGLLDPQESRGFPGVPGGHFKNCCTNAFNFSKQLNEAGFFLSQFYS